MFVFTCTGYEGPSWSVAYLPLACGAEGPSKCFLSCAENSDAAARPSTWWNGNNSLTIRPRGRLKTATYRECRRISRSTRTTGLLCSWMSLNWIVWPGRYSPVEVLSLISFRQFCTSTETLTNFTPYHISKLLLRRGRSM